MATWTANGWYVQCFVSLSIACGVTVSDAAHRQVADKMSSRFTYDKIDLYFGRDLRGARQFGVKRGVRISW